MKTFKILKSELAFNGDFIKVRKDTISLPNGKTMTYEYVDRIEAVAIFPILKDSILLIKQYRHPLRKFSYDLPAGSLSIGKETPEEEAKRELKEETGYDAKNLYHLGKYNHAPGCLNSVVHLFAAKNLTKGNQHLDPTEFIEPVEIPISKFEAFIEQKEIEPIVPLGYFLANKRGII